ncbi:unnamed protein product [Lupinus luteus]|uniref:Uncharacterized protein n=1 Tax=Lupinus luteus TaxID=3873 RepID=A0AAV1W017_LUPLU
MLALPSIPELIECDRKEKSAHHPIYHVESVTQTRSTSSRHSSVTQPRKESRQEESQLLPVSVGQNLRART